MTTKLSASQKEYRLSACRLDGSRLIERSHSLHVAESVLNVVEEVQRELTAVAGPDSEQGIGLPYHRVGRDQCPGFAIGTLEQCAGRGVVGVLRHEVREERAALLVRPR